MIAKLWTGAWLDAARVRRWAGLCMAVQLLVGGVMIAGTHGWLVKLDRPTTTDFVSFYAAGTLAGGADPARVYDRAAHYAAEQAATAPGIGYVYFFYPPVYLLYCRVLAWLPYLLAFLVFEALGAGLCAAVLHRLLGAPRAVWVLPVVAFSPALWNMCIGQNALLTAGLFGAGTWLLHRRRDLAAGLVLGLLCYKPHTGLLLPVALLAARNWRAILGAAIGVAGSVALSGVVFGWRVWRVFLAAMLHAPSNYASGTITPFSNMVGVGAALRDHGVGATAALAVQSVVALGVASAVAWCWRRKTQTEARYTVLIGGALLVMPVVLFYDLTALVIAAAWMVRAAQPHGFLPSERAGLAFAWITGLLSYPLAHAAHLPLGLASIAAVFAISVRRCIVPDYRSVNPGLPTIAQASSAIHANVADRASKRRRRSELNV